MYKLAIVEDDEFLREEIVSLFQKNGYSVTGISDFTAPEKELMALLPELIVLDVNLPGKSGFELCKYLKAKTSIPVLILTARDTLTDELTALGIGADDFVVKPCPAQRLLARAGRLLKAYSAQKSIIHCPEFCLDTDTYKLTYKNKYIILPETEGKYFACCLKNALKR